MSDPTQGERVARALWAGFVGITDPEHDYDNPGDWQRLCTEADRDVFRLAAAQVVRGLEGLA